MITPTFIPPGGFTVKVTYVVDPSDAPTTANVEEQVGRMVGSALVPLFRLGRLDVGFETTMRPFPTDNRLVEHTLTMTVKKWTQST